MQFSFRKLFFIHILIWILVELVVNPIGNFPLNDDWAYAQNVFFLSEEGRFDFSDWPAMTLIVQVLWGTLFCKIFGFSFTVLRFSTLLLGVFSSWMAFLFFKQYTNKAILAYAGALLLLLNPLFFVLANSFMTEIPFLAFFIPGLHCFSKALDDPLSSDINKYWFGGIAFSVLATMVRQPGLLLPLSFAGVYLLKHLKALNLKTVIVAGIPFLVSFLTYKWYSVWLEATQPLPPTYGKISKLFTPFLDGTLCYKMASRTNDLLFYSGWFLLPMTVFLFSYYWKNSNRFQKGVAAVLAMLISSSFCWYFKLFPQGNVIDNFRLGPKTLFNDRKKDYLHEFILADDYWLLIKWIGIIAAVLLLFELVLAAFVHMAQKRWSYLMAFFFFLAYYGFLILNPFYCDRYTLIVVPLLIAFLMPPDFKGFSINWSHGLAAAFFLIITYFSVAGTKDYLSWNRTRWDIAYEMNVAKGVPTTELYGGFEYYSWYNRPETRPVTTAVVDNTKYMIAFESYVCGWRLEKTYPYKRWMPPGTGHLYVHTENKMTIYKDILCDSEQKGNTKGDLITSDTSILLSNRATRDSSVALSGKYSIRLDKKHPFSFACKMDIVSPCHQITATVWRKRKAEDMETGKKRPSIIAVKTEDFYYHEATVIDTRSDGWEQLQCELQLSNHTFAKEVEVFVWNNSGETQWYDDFRLVVNTN